MQLEKSIAISIGRRFRSKRENVESLDSVSISKNPKEIIINLNANDLKKKQKERHNNAKGTLILILMKTA